MTRLEHRVRSRPQHWLAAVLLAWHAPLLMAQGAGFDVRALQSALSGRWQGTNDCGAHTDLALQFDKSEVQGSAIVLHGTAKSGSKIDSLVLGRYDAATGLLSIDGNLVPEDPDFCVGTKVLGKCMQLTVGSIITPQKSMEEHRKQRAALAATSAFALEVARSDDGATLTGTARGQAFDCPAMQLSRGDRGAASTFAPRSAGTERAALARIDSAAAGNGGPARGVWLEALARRGDAIAMADLGRQYEAGTDGRAPDAIKAVTWYLKAAQAGEARAQRRLADIYARGQGVPANPAQSARWAQAAKDTTAWVGRYCVAPAMIEGYELLFDSMKKDPTSFMVGMATTALTGLAMDEGTISIEAAGIEEVTTRDGPFLCRIVGKRVGASVRNVVPSFTKAGYDQDGDPLYYDNRGEAASNEAIASIANTLMSKGQATQAFQVVPDGPDRFHVTLVQQMISTGNTHATDVIIDPATLVDAGQAAAPSPTERVTAPSPVPALPMTRVGAAAPAPAPAPVPAAAGPIDPQRERAVWSLCQSAKGPAMCQAYLSEFPAGPHSGQARGILSDMTGEAAPAAAPPARPAVAAPIDGSGKDDAAIFAAINTGFVQWSREWQFDHYLGNSAKVAQRRCAGSACQVGGEVQFQRMGHALPLAFTANLARQPNGQIVASRLCYSDPSSGTSECKDF